MRISRSVLPLLVIGLLHDLLWFPMSGWTPLASLLFAFACGWWRQEQHWFTAIVLSIAPVVLAGWWHPIIVCLLFLFYWLAVEAGHDLRAWWDN